MYYENQYLPLSALQHLIFCRRQCALIHIERLWMDNDLTAEGELFHETVDSQYHRNTPDKHVVSTIMINSSYLGLIGKSDIVEFIRIKDNHSMFNMNKLEDWQVFPVEYKKGKPKADHSDEVQLCAQAICLEEMLNVNINEGALFYGKTRRRFNVVFSDDLRELTRQTAENLHELFNKGETPKPHYSKRCRKCSFYNYCMPEVLGKKKSVEKYLLAIFEPGE